MDKETLESVLRRLKIDVSIEVFKKEDIDLDVLKRLSDKDLERTLKELELSIGNRMKICLEIKALKSQKGAVKEKYTSKKDVARKSIDTWKEKEIRIVLIGKTGSGKSATGNTILGTKHFKSSVSGSSVTTVCAQKSSIRFGRKILIVDTPGIFDTNQNNKNIQQEIVKCISISSPGPHAFVLVLNIARYTEEEEKSVQHFVDSFGEKIFRYFIVLFTRKDDLDEEGKCLMDHINSVPANLKVFIEKCGGRVIAFNNRLKGEEGDKQVNELLTTIFDNVEKNNGECYKNEMYIEAERLLLEREAEIRRKAQIQRDKELKDIQEKLRKEFSEKAEKHKTQTAEEFMKWKEEFAKQQEKELKAKEQEAQKKYEKEAENAREIARGEVEEGQGIGSALWGYAKLVLPGFFTTYF